MSHEKLHAVLSFVLRYLQADDVARQLGFAAAHS
jgi:hypothetical protein